MNDHKNKRIGYILESATRIAKLSFTQAFKELGVDITPEQWTVMDTIQRNGPMSQKDIGDVNFKNAPTISRIIDILVKKGFVDRVSEKDDRRKTLISLTAKGRSLVKQCQSTVDRLRKTSWNHLSDDDYEVFTKIVNQVFQNFQSYIEDPS